MPIRKLNIFLEEGYPKTQKTILKVEDSAQSTKIYKSKVVSKDDFEKLSSAKVENGNRSKLVFIQSGGCRFDN